MDFQIRTQGLQKVSQLLAKMSGEQFREAVATAMTDTAFQVRREMQDEIARQFDRPTPYILRSVQVKRATKAALVAEIAPTYYGKAGTDPQSILKAQVDGGRRRLKRSEVALRNAGILPPGFVTAIPETPFPGSDDGRGNMRGPFVVQLLSYFAAFGEQGYRANMTERRKKNLARKNNGLAFFVSYGALRDNRASHLAPGIWARQGAYGVDVRPVLMFVREPDYKPRLSFAAVLKGAQADAYFERRLSYRIRKMMGV